MSKDTQEECKVQLLVFQNTVSFFLVKFSRRKIYAKVCESFTTREKIICCVLRLIFYSFRVASREEAFAGGHKIEILQKTPTNQRREK